MALFLGAGAPAPARPVEAGKLIFWSPRDGATAFHAKGLTVEIAPLPCGTGSHGDGGCHFDGVNNQASVTVHGAGIELARLVTNNSASWYHLGIIRVDRRDARPGVVIVDDAGGSAGLAWVHVLVPSGDGFRRVDLHNPGSDIMIDPSEDMPKDLNGDGRIDIVGRSSFGATTGCYACRASPPIVLTIRDGQSADISADPRVRRLFEQDMVLVRPRCFSTQAERNGACAAYVADAARAGRFRAAWAQMLRHYNPAAQDFWTGPPGGPRYTSFPPSLRAYLILTGYLPASR